MTVSNPATFNDPLDCLLLHYFDNLKNKTESLFDGYVYKLAKEAHSYVKIRCFVRNIPLSINKDEETTPRSKVEERYNPLMWAHYADGHKGYCVKYKFPASMTEVKDGGNAEVCVFSLWGNINYVDSIDLNEQLNVGDAFFTKSKVWE